MIITTRFIRARIKFYTVCANNICTAIDTDLTLSGTKIRELHICYNDAVSKIELLNELLNRLTKELK